MSEIWDDRRKALEDEYFRRKDQEALEKLRAEMAVEAARKERGAAGAAMPCPRCDGTLTEIDFEDVKVDRCSKCKGLWLDAGELEQLIKRDDGGTWLSRMWQGGGDVD